MGVSVRCQHFKHTIVNSQKCHIKSTSTKIEYKNIGFSSLLVHTISNGSSSRFVNDTLHLHTRNGSCILGCLALSIVKVSRNGNNGILDFFSKERLGSELHFLENHS
mmetsp:Transcript_14101/g.21410  ORF Transcript_14101/g.21410 Transcript_14101/m.21410 type:complete len:107 (+) Transcript_14101:1305-1625(+)